MLCTHRARLSAIHVHQHQDAFLQTIQKPETMILQNSPHPHESQDKGAARFGSVTWAVPSTDMNPVISSALTPTSYTTGFQEGLD